MKRKNKVKGLFLILAVAMTMTIIGPTFGADFEGSIVITADSDPVCVGEIVTITAVWTTNKDVTYYEWSVDGVDQGENAIPNEEKQNGTRYYYLDTTDLDTGEHTVCLHIWHHTQGRNVTECVTITVEECGCECDHTETAYAYCDTSGTCFRDLGFENWGWTIGPLPELEEGQYYTLDIYAGAGQCDLTKGSIVGTLYVSYTGGTATVTYVMETCRTLKETHLYIGSDILPTGENEEFTVAPGQYGNTHEEVEDVYDQYVIEGLSGEIYLIAHAVVCVDPVVE